MPAHAEQYAARMALGDEPKLCITPGCDEERRLKRDGSAYSSIHCDAHINSYLHGPELSKCGLGCGAERRKSLSGYNTSTYCSIHDRMTYLLGTVAEVKEWYQNDKVLVPSGARRDARTDDGFLYFLFWPPSGLAIIGIAASRALVEARTRTHELVFPGLQQIEVRSCRRGGAFKLESIIKLHLRRNDHFPYVPAGTHKWTETFAYHDFISLYLQLTEPGYACSTR